MFCDKCGTAIASGAQFCSSCGKAVGAAPIAAQAPAARPASDGRVQRHIQLLATLWLVNGILRFAEVGSISSSANAAFPGRLGSRPAVHQLAFDFLPSDSMRSAACWRCWRGALALAGDCFNASLGLVRWPGHRISGAAAASIWHGTWHYTIWVLLPSKPPRSMTTLPRDCRGPAAARPVA